MKKTSRHAILAILLVVGSMLVGCRTEDPVVVCGREWNPALQIVADTSTEFNMGDPLYIQFRYGTGFFDLDAAVFELFLRIGQLFPEGVDLFALRQHNFKEFGLLELE